LLADQDKGGWVFVTTSKEAGCKAGLSIFNVGAGLGGNAVHLVNIAMNNL
jgi:hypothetical protein